MISVKKKQINCTTPFFLGARRAPRSKSWVHREKVWVHRAPVHPLISNTDTDDEISRQTGLEPKPWDIMVKHFLPLGHPATWSIGENANIVSNAIYLVTL